MQVARLLDLGSSNQLPEQFLQLADIPDEMNQELHKSSDGFTFFDSMTNDTKKRVLDRPHDRSSLRFSRDATHIIAELVVAHDQVLSALISQSAQLGADAWVDHEASWAETENINCQISRAIMHYEKSLNAAYRRAQNVQTHHSAQGRISKQRSDAENQSLAVHTECLVAHELMNRGRAIEAWQHAKLEANAERERGDWLSEGAQHAVSVRAAQVIERARQARILVRLQHSLRIVCAEHCHAALAYKVHKSSCSADALVVSQLQILRVREQLRNEGHKRRSLHELEINYFRVEIRRLLADRESKIERNYLLLAVASARLECDYVPGCVPNHLK